MPLPASEPYDFCSVYSRQAAGEPLRATATRADIGCHWNILAGGTGGPFRRANFPRR